MRCPAYIWHVTLNTGDGDHSPRSDVRDNVIMALAPLVAANGDHALPVPGYRLKVTRAGQNLLATVSHPNIGPLATIAVARRSTNAAKLWVAMHEQCPDAKTHVGDVPHAPWCAVVLHPALNDDPGATRWLGDFERCLAWTWIER